MSPVRIRHAGMPVALVAMLALALAACTTAATPTAAPTAAGTTVKVTLQEWSVLPVPTSTAAGKVTFEVTNVGPADPHEFVVIKTDLDAFALPTDATGKVSEGGAIEPLGEIEDVAVGSTQSLTLDLVAGHYVLICNIYTEAEQEAHYKMGMSVNFTVQ